MGCIENGYIFWNRFPYLLILFYRLYRDQLHLTRTHLDSLVSDTTSTLDILSSLSEAFKAVEAQTTAFRTRCEALVADQKRITKLADDMEENLRYYLYLEPITKRLNAPGAGNIVRGKEFTEMLSSLDNCLDYMQGHVCHPLQSVPCITHIYV